LPDFAPMPAIRYDKSPWVDRAPRSRRPTHPAFRGTLEIPIAIVGGGLAGCATAYALAAAGLRAALVDAGNIGEGATARATGLLLAVPGVDYLGLEGGHGKRVARALWQDTRRAALDAQATLRRLKIRCSLKPAEALTWARNDDEAKRLRRELRTLRGAGIDASWVAARALKQAAGVDGAGAIKTRGHASLDPLAAALGLARAAAVRGGAVFERSPVRKIRQTRSGVEITAGKGTLLAETVIIATGGPRPLFPALARHFIETETYAVLTPSLPASLRRAGGTRRSILEDRWDPPHHLCWTPDDRILWSGADQPRQPARTRRAVLVQRTGQLMYELSLALPELSGVQPDYGWHSPSSRTSDSLPFIGTHRNYPQHLFALGLGASATAAFLASRLLVRACQNRPDRTDAYFGFDRIAGRH
jgi:glycine/D-amino acid oxidase-like deaminating enzyme